MEPTLLVCPRSTFNSLHSGTDQSLHKPDQDPVARILESGLKVHQEIGLVSAICDASTSNVFNFFCISCCLAIRVASGKANSSRNFAILSLALGNEYSAIQCRATRNDPGPS